MVYFVYGIPKNSCVMNNENNKDQVIAYSFN